MITSSFWLGRRVFLTGHTGFKGSWLSLMLGQLNAATTGFALPPPTEPSLFQAAAAAGTLADERGDIADLPALCAAMTRAEPEIVIHMAAQPLVKAGYADPVGTYRTNVMGTVNLLEAVRGCPSVQLVLIVTTDKCYEPGGRAGGAGFAEGDPLGGPDPYSSSKACAELVTAAYRESFLGSAGVTVMSARAGNVIGGGDFAADRLVPDAVRAFMAGVALPVRNPAAVRPWQHVLDALYGYLLLSERALSDRLAPGSWNFGPDPESERNVEAVVAALTRRWGKTAGWRSDGAAHPRETAVLRIDSAKARKELGWSPALAFADSIALTSDWYRAFAEADDIARLTRDQIAAFLGPRVRLTSPLRREQQQMPDTVRRYG